MRFSNFDTSIYSPRELPESEFEGKDAVFVKKNSNLIEIKELN